MLNKQDNELITRVGPDTPMGEVMRHYWLPVLLPWEIEPDGRPLRVRLLGENLIAFRNSSGRVAFIADNCPHRGASLYFGRNEEEGLRCVYHGWKFDATGKCVDMPNEPAESNFKDKVRATAYPGREWGGIIWCYMGRREPAPELPQYEWCVLPENQRRLHWKVVRECNWLQALEGDIDSSHTGFLHSTLDRASVMEMAGLFADNAPVLEALDTEIGTMYGARRSLRADSYYWRITQFVMPCLGMFPAGLDGQNPLHLWVPIDDENTLSWGLDWHPLRSFTEQEIEAGRFGAAGNTNTGGGAELLPATTRAHGAWYTVANRGNDYLQDRDLQRSKSFSGIPTVALQDTAVTESMGPIYQRDQEHLGTSDLMIIRTRQRLIGIARALRDHGEPPPGAGQPEMFKVRSLSVFLPRDMDWISTTADWLAARGGLPKERINVPLRQ